MPRRRVFVRGIVQGVSFRYYTRLTASGLGLRGWVRNRSDGRSVEALVEGDLESVEEFVRWCHEGPPSSRVDSVEVTEEEGDKPLEEFTVRSTA